MFGFGKEKKTHRIAEEEFMTVPPVDTPMGVNAPLSSTEGDAPAKRLGQILIDEGRITSEQLGHALAKQQSEGGFIGQILVGLGYVTQDVVVSCLVKQCKIPHLNLLDYDVSKEMLSVIPQELCVAYNILPIDKLGRILTIAMVNPFDVEALEKVRAVCPELRIKPILCDWEHLQIVIGRLFGKGEEGASKNDDAATYGLRPLRTAAPAPPPEPLQSPPQLDTPETRAAMEAVVSSVLEEATLGAVPTPSQILLEPTPSQPTVRGGEGAGEAIQKAMATRASHPQGDAPRATEARPAAASVAPAASATPPSGEIPHLDDLVRTLVRDALREDEGKTVARMNRQDLEARDAERARREKHASVSPFDAMRRRMATSNPEARAEADERVLSAMRSDRLLAGFTFDGFVTGKNNAFTFKLCEAVSQAPGSEYNPFFVFGDVGLGKTHLVNAVGNAIQSRNPDSRVGYVSSSRFASRLGEAMRDDAVDAFRANYCHWDVLILDDIQFLGGRVEAQEEFFHIFNVLQQEGRQIIIASDKAPDRLGLLEQRLVSRFAGGIVVNIRPPEWETRVAILEHHAAVSGAPVPQEVLAIIATRVPNDVRKMIGALRKLTAHAALVGEPISAETVNDLLSHLGAEEAA